MQTTVTQINSTIRPWLATLFERPFFGLTLLLAIGIIVATNQPLAYTIAVGREDRADADLPFVDGWNTPEEAAGITYRWTAEKSTIHLVGLPYAPLAVSVHVIPALANPAMGAGVLSIANPAHQLAVIPLPSEQRYIHSLLPLTNRDQGCTRLAFNAPTWTPANDPRVLGVPISRIQIHQLTPNQSTAALFDLAIPPINVWWPLATLALVWPPLRRWSGSRIAGASAALGVVLLLAALAVDRLRFALAAEPALWALVVGIVLALGLRIVMRWSSTRLNLDAPVRLLDTVALLFLVMFTLRYAGKLYPFSMPGDLGFHVNRQNNVLMGNLLLVSRHRGIDFPYPPALYLMLLPFRLLPITPEALVEFADALFGPLGIVPIAALSWHAFRNQRAATFTAISYALLAPGMMALWWSFMPHIFAQEFVSLLLAGIVIGWPHLATRRGIVLAMAGLTFLFASHFGFYLNVSLMLGVLLLVGLGFTRNATRQRILGLLVAFVGAQVIVAVLLYTAYIPLFLVHLQNFTAGGMGAVQGGRTAIPRAQLLGYLWQDGFVAHYATLGAPLALLGLYQLFQRRAFNILLGILAAILFVSTIQGAIPFITSSTITTRWLSFTAPLIAIGLGYLLSGWWRRGLPGRILTLMVLAWIAWHTLWLWVQALAYRVRPPEPF